MIAPEVPVLTTEGYTVQPRFAMGPGNMKTRVYLVPYKGIVYHIFTEQGDNPLVCTPDQYIMTRNNTGGVTWKRAKNIQRGMYVGMPIPKAIDGVENTDAILLRQLKSIYAGIPRAIRKDSLDDPSAVGDVILDETFCWFRVHDLEVSKEPFTLMHSSKVCIANNTCCMEFP